MQAKVKSMPHRAHQLSRTLPLPLSRSLSLFLSRLAQYRIVHFRLKHKVSSDSSRDYFSFSYKLAYLAVFCDQSPQPPTPLPSQ